METAFLFVGQGSQRLGMGVALAESCADCRATFETADNALGFSLSRLMAEGPEQELCRTENAQPALVTVAVAHARHLVSLGIAPDALAGHSLGQYAALVVAGAFDFESAVPLVAERGRLMQQAVPEGQGAMMAVVGLERHLVYEACEAAREIGVVGVACHNYPGQTVISGAAGAVAAAAERCEEEGGGVVPLQVSAPFHCELLSPMVPAFAELVGAIPFVDPKLPVIDNVSARPLPDARAVRQSLIDQWTKPVLFEESLRYLVNAGVRRFIQCGPSRVLLGLARRVAPTAEFETFEEAAMRVAACQ
jgi:[acyl-carrier-protein] S-malonyltransferase